MNNRDKKKHRFAWWEYPLWLVVSLFILIFGSLAIAIGAVLSLMVRSRLKALIIVAIVIALSVFLYFNYQYRKEIDSGDRVTAIIIEPGDSFGKVASQLKENNVIDALLTMKLAARINGSDKKLTPGRYEFTGENSVLSVLERLEAADFVRIKVTIPEGSTIWQTASILSSKMGYDSAGVVALCTNDSLLAKFEIKNSLEGFLFPETYFFPWGTKAVEALAIMVATFDRETEKLWTKEAPLGLTRYEVVVLASIIEAEARIAKDRPLISSVYTNRLRRKMKLDADPTVIYGLGGLERPLYRKDLRRDTPYNTYMHKGLPPTPINSPGLASIEAALDPAESDYLFFVADNNGGHVFTRTNAEHNRAIKRIRSEAKSN